MGGKTSQSTQQVQIPSSVLAAYQSVNAQAQKTAATPFQSYGTGTNADGTAQQFVAPVNSQQQTGIANTNAAANEAQPYYANATNTLNAAQAATQPYNAAAATGIANAQANTQPYNSMAAGTLANAQYGTQGVNNAATGLAAASAGQVNATPLTGQQINQYLSPYLSDVVGSEAALLNQNNQQQQAGQLGTAIQSGAFGGDRTGIAAANLEQQQNLANANIYSGLLNTGYNNALATAQQQQGVNLSAAQANRAALGSAGSELASIGQTAYGEGANTASQAAALGQTAYNEAANTATTQAGLGQTAYNEGANTASQLGALGTGAQTAALQGANAQIGAGTVEQQTQQAQDTAEYNQFLQQQSYPFQIDQFLANIAEGTGALSGSTTTTTQPGGFFSDRRLKKDIKKVGKTFTGDDIVTYKMGDDPRTRMGLIAQDVEKRRPSAVGVSGGFKTLDYDEATKDAAKKGKFARGGVAAGGFASGGFAAGGYVDPSDLSAILQAQKEMYSQMGGGAGVGGPRGGMARIPSPTGGTPQLVTASGGLRAQPTGAQNLATTGNLIKQGQGFYNDFQKAQGANDDQIIANQRATDAANNQAAQATMYANNGMSIPNTWDQDMEQQAVQASAPSGFASGGSPYASVNDYTELDIPDENSHNQLAKAPDLPKQAPTGFQQLMSMGSGMGGMGGMVGGLFSGAGAGDYGSSAAGASDLGTEAATIADSHGGLVIGRRHRDAGGDAVDAASSDRQSTVSGDAPDATLATAPPLQHAAPNTSLDSVKHLALAAGEAYLGDYPGAAAQLYDTYQSTQTNNAKGGRVGRARGGFADGGDPTDDSDAGAATGVAPASSDITGGAKGTPWYKDTGKLIPLAQALAAMGTAPTRHLGVALAAGLGAGAQSYQQEQDALSGQANVQAKTQGVNLANQIAKKKLDFLNTPTPYSQPNIQDQPPSGGASLQDQLRVSNYVPQVTAQENAAQQDAYRKSLAWGTDTPVKAVNQQIENRKAQATYQNQQKMQSAYDEAVYTYNHTADPTLKASAAAAADAYHQYTGDKPSPLPNGSVVNSRTTQPFIGQEATRLSPDTYTRLMADAKERVTVPAGDASDPGKTVQVPKWQLYGGGQFATPEQYVASLPPQGTPDVPGRTQTPAAAPQRAPVRQQPNVPVAPTKPAAAIPQAPPTPTARPSDFLEKTIHDKAFSDPTYRIPQGTNQLGTSFGATTTGNANAEVEKRKILKADSDATIQSSSAAIQYARAAQQILDSKNSVVVGKYGPAAAAVSAWIGEGNDASKYQELAKYLGNLAVQSGKGNFPQSTQSDRQLQFQELSPNTKNTDEGLRDLLNSVIKQNQWMNDTANRSKEYLDGGYNGSAQDFFKWNQKYWPRELVNVPKSHLDDLVQHPEHAADFKKKYGVLPGGG